MMPVPIVSTVSNMSQLYQLNLIYTVSQNMCHPAVTIISSNLNQFLLCLAWAPKSAEP